MATPFRSRAEMLKWEELMKKGEITKNSYNDRLAKTKLHSIPERVPPRPQKFIKVIK